MSTDLWVIEINEKINPEFDPIDLFVRLNNKPYPSRKIHLKCGILLFLGT